MFWMRSLGFLLFYLATVSLPLFGSDTDASPTNSQEAYFDLIQVFQSCPLIYSLLILMSIIAMSIWLYSMITLRASQVIPKTLLDQLHTLFNEKKYDEAFELCQKKETYTASILAAGIAARRYGPQLIIESMTSEGKRIALILWQRISLLNEIAVIAPMVGLLGTVVGLFFAFYDTNRNAESMASLFDGLGIAIGTTVVGLIVSILAMILYTTLKFRVINLLNTIESETLSFTPKLEME
jgi:biopolymer transport protein ExbB